MPVSPDARRKIVPITTQTGTDFRWMTTSEARPMPGTKWAACEIKNGQRKPQGPNFVTQSLGTSFDVSIGFNTHTISTALRGTRTVTSLTISAVHSSKGVVTFKAPRMMKFNSPCPLGKVPKPPKKTKKQSKGEPAAPPISTIQEATPI